MGMIVGDKDSYYDEYFKPENENQISEAKQVFIILQKYMKHVELSSGVTFIDGLNDNEVQFSPYEVNFLKTVEQQIKNDE